MVKEKKVEDAHSEQEAVEEKKDKVLKTEKKKNKKKAEKKKTKKTAFNFLNWKKIEARNRCGATRITARWSRWTVLYSDHCRWYGDGDSGDCMCPDC